jgi:haloacetate dehalogenase
LFSPVEDWQAKATGKVTGRALQGGHFIPDQIPEVLLEEMLAFFER